MQEIEDNKVKKLADVITLADGLITIDKTQYKIVENHDNGFNEERIEERYNPVLNKYDYIVGDWGYDQLRFKGFYEDQRNESTLDNRISHLEDYLIEYCNFGCAYFVLEKVKKAPLKPHKTTRHRKASHHRFKTRNTNNTHTNSIKTNKSHNNQKRKNKVSRRHATKVTNKKKPNASTKKTFKIRKIGEKNK
ncbi:YutD family protein [Companilactobacillus halodurans]|uniref:DUF1027 domain-containing protein n=1 Tax=Companilactobacillus halodurans TaxID=2584183 RepID=A0A5P0ZV01_9LACO|nr:YutD family protein [Companilactobacillus halodurans]MQS76525.1 DUF1027 domain-containing protein [Companilactobacillus halodurans]MQS96906.1 DUF1027 domain-containing protein [Companilactobacillus halodurans]